MPELFSDRYGYSADDVAVEITVREDASDELRSAIPQIARQCDMSFTTMREVICQILLVQPDPSTGRRVCTFLASRNDNSQ